jgi:hypothetical protein
MAATLVFQYELDPFLIVQHLGTGLIPARKEFWFSACWASKTEHAMLRATTRVASLGRRGLASVSHARTCSKDDLFLGLVSCSPARVSAHSLDRVCQERWWRAHWEVDAAAHA